MAKLPDRVVLEIVTPEKQVIKALVDEVLLPGTLGYIGVLPGHTPLLTTLSIGEVMYRQKDKKHYLFLCGGFAEILPNKVIILAEIVEKPEEIDIQRAESAKMRAEKRLHSKDPNINIERAIVSLTKAQTRISIAQHYGVKGKGEAGKR